MTEHYLYAADTPYTGAVTTKDGKLYGRAPCGYCDNGIRLIYMHVQGGRCFHCWGIGTKPARLYTAKQAAGHIKARAKTKAKEKARFLVNREIGKIKDLKFTVARGFAAIAKIKAAAVSQHVGKVGERIEIDAKIVFAKGFDGYYGTTWFNTMTDPAGNVFHYRGNRLGQKGDAIKIKATVKAHDEYDGTKQTVIERPKEIA